MASPALVYKVEDRSILLPYYRRFLVDPLLPLLPASLNPNTITHVGHLLNLVGTATLVLVWPKGGWVFAAAMVLLQLYMWCDNADGAHARRTNQCSAMGEFLDHGLDQLNTVYIGYLTAMSLGVKPIWWVAITLVIPGAGAITYWEQSQTGTFRLGLLNQVESLTVLSIALTVSAIFGSQIWAEVTLFGVSLQTAMLLWSTSTIIFGMLRATQRVGASGGLSAIAPALPFFAFGLAVWYAARIDAITTITAVTLATCANVYFGMRMLTLRLHAQAPRVELVLIGGTAVLGAVIAWRVTGHELGSMVGPALTAVACVVFGAQALADTRKSIQRVESLPVRSAR